MQPARLLAAADELQLIAGALGGAHQGHRPRPVSADHAAVCYHRGAALPQRLIRHSGCAPSPGLTHLVERYKHELTCYEPE